MTDLQAVELNVNACIVKINKMYKVLDLTLVSFNEAHLIEAFARVTALNASLFTFRKIREDDNDVFLYNRVDNAIINVFISELNQALFSITFLYDKKFSTITDK